MRYGYVARVGISSALVLHSSRGMFLELVALHLFGVRVLPHFIYPLHFFLAFTIWLVSFSSKEAFSMPITEKHFVLFLCFLLYFLSSLSLTRRSS